MAKNYYAEQSDITLDCAIPSSTMTVHLASPSVYEEDVPTMVERGMLWAAPSFEVASVKGIELCQGTPVTDPQLQCGDTIIEVNPNSTSFIMKFGSKESGYTFSFERYVGSSWQDVGSTYAIPLPGAALQRWRIKAVGSSTVYFDPYIKGQTDCIEEPD